MLINQNTILLGVLLLGNVQWDWAQDFEFESDRKKLLTVEWRQMFRQYCDGVLYCIIVMRNGPVT